jgi:hypothetical protein
MLEDRLAFPFEIEILGAPAIVGGVDLDDAEEIVTICRRGNQEQMIPILNLTSPPPLGWEWVEAYRRWVRGRQLSATPARVDCAEPIFWQ